MTKTEAGSLFLALVTSYALGTQATQHSPVGLTAEQREILSHMQIVHFNDGIGGVAKTIRISGVNVQIVNGLGATNGYAPDPLTTDAALTQTNALGNLIVGYNETGNPIADYRYGSHNIVCGTANSYSSFGGFVVASDNMIAGPYCTVTGGQANLAGTSGFAPTGGWSSVSGGMMNRAVADWASVQGGFNNQASPDDLGHFGEYASVSGGRNNNASGLASSVRGGSGNSAVAPGSTISGGAGRFAFDDDDWVAGSLLEDF